MKDSDLTYDEKQRLLSHIRDQTGQIEYDRMVDALGEDGLIDLVLEKVGGTTNASAVSSSNSPSTISRKVWRVIRTIFVVVGILIILWLWGQEPWSTIFNCLWGLLVTVWLLLDFIGWITNRD